MTATATTSIAHPIVSDSIVDMFGSHKDIIEDDYKITKVDNEKLDNRIVRLTLKNPKHVTLLLDHPWLLNGNYSTPTSVLIFDSNGGSHAILSWTILRILIQLMPIADLDNKFGYSVYRARFRNKNNSDKMHLYLKDFNYIEGDVLKFPPPETPVDIDHSTMKYSKIDPLSIPLATSTNYNVSLDSAKFNTVADIEIGSFDYPYSGKISSVHSNQDLIEEYELIITFCSKEFLINSANISESTKSIKSTPIAGGRSITSVINYYRFKDTIYQSYLTSYGLYNVVNDMSIPREVDYRIAALHPASMKHIEAIKKLTNLPTLQIFVVYSHRTPKTETAKSKLRLYMFRKSRFNKPLNSLTLQQRGKSIKIVKVLIKDDLIYKLTSNIPGHKENFDRYLIGNSIYYSPDKDQKAIIYKRQEIENDYINRNGIDHKYLKRTKGSYRYYDYGKYKAKKLSPLPDTPVDLPHYYRLSIFGNEVIYEGKKSDLIVNRVLYKDQIEWKIETDLIDIETLVIADIKLLTSRKRHYPLKDLKEVVINIFRPGNRKHDIIIYQPTQETESFETTQIYDETPEGLEWKTYDAAPYIIRQFLPPNSYPINSAVFNIYPTKNENEVECVLKPSALFTSAFDYLTDVCSNLDFKAHTSTKNEIVTILELLRGKFDIERYLQGRGWNPIKFKSADIDAHMKSNMNPANIDIGSVEDLHPDIYDVFIERIVRSHKSWIPSVLRSSINYIYEEFFSRNTDNIYELDLFKGFNIGPMGVVVNTKAIESLIDILELYSLRSH